MATRWRARNLVQILAKLTDLVMGRFFSKVFYFLGDIGARISGERGERRWFEEGLEET